MSLRDIENRGKVACEFTKRRMTRAPLHGYQRTILAKGAFSPSTGKGRDCVPRDQLHMASGITRETPPLEQKRNSFQWSRKVSGGTISQRYPFTGRGERKSLRKKKFGAAARYHARREGTKGNEKAKWTRTSHPVEVLLGRASLPKEFSPDDTNIRSG